MSSPPTTASTSHPSTPTPTTLFSFGASPHPPSSTTSTTAVASTQTPTASSVSTPSLRAVHQDRQARNKSPYSGMAVWCGEEGGVVGDDEGGGREEKLSYTDDSYEAVERRRWAATILDCPELLMMHAQARQDTIPSTRLHFTKLLCGYEDIPRKTRKPKNRRSGRVVKE